MNASPLERSQAPDALSRIGGAAQGGSAKPPQERAELDREHEQRQEDKPAGREGTVGGLSNDNRTDAERASEERASQDPARQK